jgi:hypothetical protein
MYRQLIVAYGEPTPAGSPFSASGGDDGEANVISRNKMFFKFQSAATLQMTRIMKAFPTVPAVFLFRDPVECVIRQQYAPLVRSKLSLSHVSSMSLLPDQSRACHTSAVCPSCQIKVELVTRHQLVST